MDGTSLLGEECDGGGHSWVLRTFGSLVERVIPRSPILAEGCYQSRAAYAKWTLPEDFFLVRMKKGELRGLGFARSIPHGGELGANS